MKVYVNDMEVVVFEGATVQDALNKYAALMLIKGRSGRTGDRSHSVRPGSSGGVQGYPGNSGRTGQKAHDTPGREGPGVHESKGNLDYSREGAKDIRSREGLKVYDSYGNPVMAGGSLSENDRIYVEVDRKNKGNS